MLTHVDKCSLQVLYYRQDLFSYSEPTTPVTQSPLKHSHTQVNEINKQAKPSRQPEHTSLCSSPKAGTVTPKEIARPLPRIQLTLIKT